MKSIALQLLALTSFVLISVTVFASINMPFSWVFYLTVVGQILLVLTVYKVLTDNYTTDKTFKDFYEDRPDLGASENYR